MGVLGLSCCLSTMPQASVQQRATEIRLLDLGGGARAVVASLDGVSGKFLFDSGWGLSAVTPEFAETIDCKPWGRITGFRAIGERVDFTQCHAPVHLVMEKVHSTIPTLGVFDVMRFMPAGSTTLAGGLGLDAFAGRALTIQMHRNCIILESKASLYARVTRAKPIQIRLVRASEGASLTVDVGVPTPNGIAWMELDTGNTGKTMIAGHVAAAIGLSASITDPQTIAMLLVPGVVVDGKALVRDLILDGDIGMDFLTHWDLILDLEHVRGWLAPAES